jgi:ABC-type nitrate/sulfonate/bicarbonate transport system substrate-binding protein
MILINRVTAAIRSLKRRSARHVVAMAAVLASMSAMAQQPIEMTIGYQSLWATGGEIFETLRRTNILELNGIKGNFKTFTYGGPLGEAAVAGEIDNIFAADAPVLRAVARIPGAKVISRTHDQRFAVVAQPDFKGGLADLRGKKLSGPFGTTTFPRCIEHIVEAGIKDPFRDMTIINQDVAEQAISLQSRAVDAVTTWDPTQERLIRAGYKVLYASKPGEGGGWMGVTGKFLSKYGDDGAVRFLKAWIMAAWWTSNNIETAHDWFAQTSRIDKDLLRVSAQADRYMKSKVSDIKTMDFVIDDNQMRTSQRVMDFLHAQKLLQARMDVAPFVDMRFIAKAQADIRDGRVAKLSDIKIVSQ